MISNSEKDDELIVKDGIVIDSNFRAESVDVTNPVIGEHNAQLSLRLHLFPIPKNTPSYAMTLKSAEEALKSDNLEDNVNCN